MNSHNILYSISESRNTYLNLEIDHEMSSHNILYSISEIRNTYLNLEIDQDYW